MKSISIKISLENEAFSENYPAEVKRILEVAAKRVENNEGEKISIGLHDSNGNRVGEVKVS